MSNLQFFTHSGKSKFASFDTHSCFLCLFGACFGGLFWGLFWGLLGAFCVYFGACFGLVLACFEHKKPGFAWQILIKTASYGTNYERKSLILYGYGARLLGLKMPNVKKTL